MDRAEILKKLKSGLVVSCQSEPPEPLASPEILTAMAKAAIMGGAVGIRANLPENIRYMLAEINVPVIGIYKEIYPDYDVFITPTSKEAIKVAETGCSIIALDATARKRPGNEQIKDIIRELRSGYDVMLMADIATFEEGMHAAEMGFDLIGTTLSGYTPETLDRNKDDLPDFELMKALVSELTDAVPVIAEGRIWTPGQALRALELGVHAVVVGTAITRPWVITERFVKAMHRIND